MSTICELVQKKTGTAVRWDRRNTGAPPAEMITANFDSSSEGALIRTASSLLNCDDTLRAAIGPAISVSPDTQSERLPVGASWSDKLASPNRDWSASAQRPRLSSA